MFSALPFFARVTLLWLVAFSSLQASDFPYRGKRVLFLGDSITHAGLYVAYLETYFALRFPGRTSPFINCGLSSETVSGLSEQNHAGGKFPRPDLRERLSRVLAKVKPDVVFACYGMNDGLFQPFDEAHFRAFQAGIRHLRETVIASGAEIILVTSPVYDDIGGGRPYYNAVLARQAAWLLKQRAAGWKVIDVFGPMNDYLKERRKTDPGFKLAQDGVHPGPLGHWLIAREILGGLGFADAGGLPDAAALVTAYPRGAGILKLVTEREELLRDAWLTATGYNRPGLPAGLPLSEAEARAQEIQTSIQALPEH